MKILIAGCGWLGSEIGRRLVARGDRAVGIRRDARAVEALRGDGIEPRIVDLCSPGAARDLPRDCDAIVACQAAGSADPRDYEAAYVEATRTLIDLAAARPGTRLVYTGSTGVFGPENGERVDETTEPRPGHASAEALLQAERQIRAAARDGVAACIVRLSGLYGPGRYGVVERVRSGHLTLGPGDDAWMNFCHLDDAASTVLALLDRGRPGAIYHASDAEPTRRRDVVRWIASRLGLEPARATEPAAGSRSRARGNRRISAERTRAELELELAYPTFRHGLVPRLGPVDLSAG